MRSIRSAEVPIPRHLATRPVHDGYVVPFFVADVNGVPDFRVADASKVEICLRYQRCWLCGEQLGRHKVFVVGPMCLVNRISSEPPSHRDCAEYAVQVCPHITHAKAKRRSANLPGDAKEPPGQMVRANPGLVVIVESEDWMPRRMDDGWLIHLGRRITNVDWWTEGRRASKAEAVTAFMAGMERVRHNVIETTPRGPDLDHALFEMGVSAGEASLFLPAG